MKDRRAELRRRDTLARLRLAAEGVRLDRLPAEGTPGHGTESRYQREVRSGVPACAACKDAHSRWVNPQSPPPKDFADEQWGRLR